MSCAKKIFLRATLSAHAIGLQALPYTIYYAIMNTSLN
jgi:hypothetical protein